MLLSAGYTVHNNNNNISSHYNEFVKFHLCQQMSGVLPLFSHTLNIVN